MSTGEIGYCELCDRDVGVVKSSPPTSAKIFFFLGLVIPVWVVTLPICWTIAAILYFKKRKELCAICSHHINGKSAKTKDEQSYLSQEAKDAIEALDAVKKMKGLIDSEFSLKDFGEVTTDNASEVISYLKSPEVTDFIKNSASIFLVHTVETEFAKVNVMFSGGRFCLDNGIEIEEQVFNYYGSTPPEQSILNQVTSNVNKIEFYRKWDELTKAERKTLRTFSLLYAEKILNENDHSMILNSFIWNDGDYNYCGIGQVIGTGSNDIELDEHEAVSLSIASDIVSSNCISNKEIISVINENIDKLSESSRAYISILT